MTDTPDTTAAAEKKARDEWLDKAMSEGGLRPLPINVQRMKDAAAGKPDTDEEKTG